MTIPCLDNIQVIDLKTGKFTPEWLKIMTELFQQLQLTMSNEGLVAPSLSDSNISKLTRSLNNTFIYDSTNNLAKVCINGSFKTIQTV